MCKWGTTIPVRVKIAAHLSSTGQDKWKDEPIDACIAPLVKALQEGGIDMLGSCCGHGKDIGEIRLRDGRTLLIVDGKRWYDEKARYLFSILCNWLVWLIRCQNYMGRIRYWMWCFRK